MEPTSYVLAQLLSLSGLVGATGAYAGVIRRRVERRLELLAAAQASEIAAERVGRHVALGRLQHTFIRSAYRRDGSHSTTPRR